MARVLSALCVALLIGGALGVAGAKAQAAKGAQAKVVLGLRRGVQWHRSRTWYWQSRAGVARTNSNRAEMKTTSVAYLRWMDRLWSKRRIAARHLAMKARRLATYSGGIAHERLWLCIHSGEGAWNANTGNGYLGGLQMTPGWGGVARPDLLSPSAQMALAERQYVASHYSSAWLSQQWPNTYPPCAGYAG